MQICDLNGLHIVVVYLNTSFIFILKSVYNLLTTTVFSSVYCTIIIIHLVLGYIGIASFLFLKL